MNTPEYLPVLSAGAHVSPKDGACVMEYVSLLAGEQWSDSPSCTHPVLAAMARAVNDRMPDSERHLLVPLIPRLFGTAETGTADERHRLRVSLAVWCAEQVAPLAPVQAAEACRVVRAWLAGTATGQECEAAAYAAAGAARAAYTAYAARAAAYAADAAANAARAACAANAAYADGLPSLLVGLLDEYDRLTGRAPSAPLGDEALRELATAVG